MQVDSNIREIIKGLSDLERKQLPYAQSVALNRTAFQAREDMKHQMQAKLDRPTPYTLRSVRVKKATKRKLEAIVFINEAQAEYLQYVFTGKTKFPKRKALVTPSKNTRLNKYGNMPRGKLQRLLSDGKHFSGVPNGTDLPAGIYRRMGRGGRSRLKLIVQYKKRQEYTKKLDFKSVVSSSVTRNFDSNFHRALALANRTAR